MTNWNIELGSRNPTLKCHRTHQHQSLQVLVFQRTSQGLWVQTCCLPLAGVVFFKDKDKWLCLNSSLVDFQKEWNFCPPGRVIKLWNYPGWNPWQLHPWKLTWNLQITQLKRKIIFQTSILGFHVNFRRCRFWWDKVHWLESFVVKVVFFAILGAFHWFVYHISLRISFFFKEITVFLKTNHLLIRIKNSLKIKKNCQKLNWFLGFQWISGHPKQNSLPLFGAQDACVSPDELNQIQAMQGRGVSNLSQDPEIWFFGIWPDLAGMFLFVEGKRGRIDFCLNFFFSKKKKIVLGVFFFFRCRLPFLLWTFVQMSNRGVFLWKHHWVVGIFPSYHKKSTAKSRKKIPHQSSSIQHHPPASPPGQL